jgi:hypothetical protein
MYIQIDMERSGFVNTFLWLAICVIIVIEETRSDAGDNITFRSWRATYVPLNVSLMVG